MSNLRITRPPAPNWTLAKRYTMLGCNPLTALKGEKRYNCSIANTNERWVLLAPALVLTIRKGNFRMATSHYTPKDVQRFWSRVDKSGGDDACWIWQGSRKGHRYGRIYMGGKTLYAHRFAYELAYGEIPDGLSICHRCDNPHCCNTSHLFAATQKENIHDMIKKGRRRTAESVVRGEQHPSHKLNWETVEFIRTRFSQGGITKAELGRQVGVDDSVIGDIIRGTAWKSAK